MICLADDRIGERVDAGDRDRAGVGTQQARDHAQRGGLAGAVRAEQAVELAGAHHEVEAVDGGAVEHFLEAADFERGERLVLVHGRLRSRAEGGQPS